MKLKELSRWILTPIVAGALAFSSLKPVQACTGARQVAMGDAGVAACNGSHSIYWNQSAMALEKEVEVSYTKQFGKVDEARYDNVISIVYPVNERIGAGIQLMNGSKGNLKEKGYLADESWIKLGLGYLLKDGKEDSWTYAIGGALTEKKINYTMLEQNDHENQREKSGLEYEASFLAERKNAFEQGDKLRFGLLAREQFGIDNENLAVRPGVAYTIPNKLGNLTTSVEFYEIDELLKEEIGRKYAKPRIGAEQTIGKEDKNFALRAGWDGAGDEGKGTLTAGLGVKYKNLGLDVAYTDKNVGWVEFSVKF